MKAARPLRVFASTCRSVPRVHNPAYQPLPRTTFAHRYASTRSRVPFGVKVRNYLAQAQHDSPIGFPLLLLAAAASLTALGFMMYDESFNEAPKFAEYPAGVEQQLRVALHYTYVRPDSDAALKHFQKAIKFAYESPLDPFGKPFIGLRIRYAEMLEHFGHMKPAIEVLSVLTKDCEKRLQEIDDITLDEATKEQRRRLLKGIIQYKVKMSSLYDSEYLQNRSMAKQVLSEAMTLLVKETQSPETKGFSEGNTADMSFGEIASILSQMGDLYATSGEEDNAVQVYMLTLQPLRAACNGSRSCKEAQILSNIASTMDLAIKKPNARINGQPATKASIATTRQATLKWANAAIAAINAVPKSDRDNICEMAQISARITRSDLWLDMGEKESAKTELTGLIPVLRAKGLTELIPQAEAALLKANS